jgi:DNA-binding NtrC family response regulator
MMESDPSPEVSSQRILVIDDEPVVGLSCQRALGSASHQVDYYQSSRAGLEAALTGEYDIILLDLVMPELDGLEVMRQFKLAGVTAEVIIITGYSTVENAVEAMKQGAADYVSKPFTPDELIMAVRKVAERSALIRENVELRRELETKQGFEGMIGESRAMERVFGLIKRVAPTDGSVLITGESGTGKEMVARAIHRLSRRKDRPFLACDCSALAPGLLESELFGHVKGSFSGAIATKLGLFETANKGTLFLDEISNISLEIQGKLLRVLESRRIKRVGDVSERDVDIRLITATNRELSDLVKEDKFREDLYYRLNVVPINVPPLRDRSGDIPRLAITMFEQFRQRNEIAVKGFSVEAMRLMEAHSWPGNVRELKNIVQRMAILCDTDRIEARHLPPEIRETMSDLSHEAVPDSWAEFKLLKQRVRDATIQNLECRFLTEALRKAEGNISRAAENVGMQRTNFHALMAKHGITADGEG